MSPKMLSTPGLVSPCADAAVAQVHAEARLSAAAAAAAVAILTRNGLA